MIPSSLSSARRSFSRAEAALPALSVPSAPRPATPSSAPPPPRRFEGSGSPASLPRGCGTAERPRSPAQAPSPPPAPRSRERRDVRAGSRTRGPAGGSSGGAPRGGGSSAGRSAAGSGAPRAGGGEARRSAGCRAPPSGAELGRVVPRSPARVFGSAVFWGFHPRERLLGASAIWGKLFLNARLLHKSFSARTRQMLESA